MAYSKGNFVYVEGFDLKEWHIRLEDLRKNVPEIVWHASENIIDPNCFSLDELYFATV